MNNSISELQAISPIDGRYRNKVDVLTSYFSEYALIRYRTIMEIEYFIALCEYPLPQLKNFPKEKIQALRNIYLTFSIEDALRVKEIEGTTNHDIKALEYFLKEKFVELNIKEYIEFIHFGLTSQDINNTAVPLSLKECFDKVYFPTLQKVIIGLQNLSAETQDVPMLARTHGQPASPTRLGKEIDVFVARLNGQIKYLSITPFCAKFGGATGNFNAHVVTYPDIDWADFGTKWLKTFGLQRSTPTTQIEHYDNLSAFFDILKRINVIFIDFCRDVWQYVAMDYFKQKIKKDEVGSSAMPHKINPIDFENAEGNFGISNAIFEHLSAKLPISRLQRDLTDSTVLRNIGVPIAHTLIGFESVIRGVNKLIVNREKIASDLNAHWEVIAEGIQTILRRENYPKPYEALKELTRTNEQITSHSIAKFIATLELDEAVKQELLAITPENYVGI